MGLLARGSRHRGFSRVMGLNRELKLSATITACRGTLSFAGILMATWTKWLVGMYKCIIEMYGT